MYKETHCAGEVLVSILAVITCKQSALTRAVHEFVHEKFVHTLFLHSNRLVALVKPGRLQEVCYARLENVTPPQTQPLHSSFLKTLIPAVTPAYLQTHAQP